MPSPAGHFREPAMRSLNPLVQYRDDTWTRRQRWRRERAIVRALVRHGLGVTLATIGLRWLLPFQWGLLGHQRRSEPYSGPEHLRMAFEDLGPTFIKLAQILSTRGDLVGVEYAAELAKLQRTVPPLPFADLAAVLDTELGVTHGEVFATIDSAAMGSGSIGQVHRATLLSGDSVVVKIQRPGVRGTIALDLEILRRWLLRYSSRRRSTTKVDSEGFFDEFAFTLMNELDYTNEGENADRLREIHREDDDVMIPAIYWDHTTSRVLVMQEVQGSDFGDATLDDRLTAADRHRLAVIALHVAFVEIFRAGFFHADPHPGNFVVTNDGKLGLLDFGMVGTLNDRQRDHFLEFVRSVGEKDSGAILNSWWAMGVTEPEAQRPGVVRDLDHLFHRVGNKSLQDIAASDMVGDLMRIAHRHELFLPANLALLFKVLAMLESAAVLIDPDFLFFQALEPEIAELAKDKLSPGNVSRRVGVNALAAARLAEGFPQRAERLLQRLETGDIEFTTKHEALEHGIDKVSRALNTLTLVVAIGLLLLAVALYVLAAETAGPAGSARLDTLQVLLSIGAGVVAIAVAQSRWTRKR